MNTVELLALVIAMVIFIVVEVRGRGTDWTAWGCILVTAVLLFARLKT